MTNEKGCDQRRGMECQRRHHPLLYLFVERRILHVDVTTIHAEEIHPKTKTYSFIALLLTYLLIYNVGCTTVCTFVAKKKTHIPVTQAL